MSFASCVLKPAPDYSRSDATGVRLTLRGGQESLQFAAFVFERERQQGPMTVEQMIVLNRLFHDRRVTTEQVVIEIQRSQNEARGENRGRVYHLAASFYKTLGRPEAYVHVHGVEPLRQEALVEEYVRAHGSIRRAKAVELCGLTERQASRLLGKMVSKNKLAAHGERKSRIYALPGPIESKPL